MLSRAEAQTLLEKYIANPALRRHCQMVAIAMEAYAKKLGEDVESWWLAGYLHDLDWEMFPDEHPNKAVNEILPEVGVSQEILDAIKAHGPHRTGKFPETPIERYLFACDELSGFIDACTKVRPDGYATLEWKSVAKRLKSPSFAAGVSREDVHEGARLIDTPLEEHGAFLINVFREQL